MQCESRPADDRESDELKEWETPECDAEQGATCSLMKTVTLLPLRYGRVETPPSGTSIGMPYSLKSRPLGYRMLRNGYVYIFDEVVDELKEYEYRNEELIGGPMDYDIRHSLYVCFSDVQWTAEKKAQITDSDNERHRRMQRVDLSDCSGAHLLTPEQAKQWVAEFSEDYNPEVLEEAHPQELEPYHWENRPYYHRSTIGKLLKQQDVQDPSETLCIVLYDHIGVLLDLSKHQENIIDWLEWWVDDNDNERKYVTGSWIESLTSLNDDALARSTSYGSDPDLSSLMTDTTEEQRDLIYQYLEVRKDFRGQEPYGTSEYLREEHSDNPLVASQLAMIDGLGEEKFHKHRDAINKLALNNYYILNGEKLGQRGLNQFVDRDGIKIHLETQGKKLSRWQRELHLVSEDRTDLLCDNVYHDSAWYFDGQQQVKEALDYEYECFKGICRSEEAITKIINWMDNNPQYTRPLFHTMTYSQQNDPMVIALFTDISSKGLSLFAQAAELIKKLEDHESGKVARIESLSNSIQVRAQAVRDNLSQAVARKMAESLDRVYLRIGSNSLPSLDNVVRDMSYAFKAPMLESIKRGEAEIVASSDEKLRSVSESYRQAMNYKQRLVSLNNRIEEVTRKNKKNKRKQKGHKSEYMARLEAERVSVRDSLSIREAEIRGYLDPTSNNNERKSYTVEEASRNKPRFAVALPASTKGTATSLLEDLKKGRAYPNKVTMSGDGLSLIIFFAQLSRLLDLVFQDEDQQYQKASVYEITESLVGTAAAGFGVALSISNNIVSARADRLAKLWSDNGVRSANVTLGKLHVRLGVYAYGLGFFSSAISTYNYMNDWVDAVKKGDLEAAAGATISAAASSGTTALQYMAFSNALTSLNTAKQKARFWGTASTNGARVASLIARWGVGLFALEMVGRFIYNRYNLSDFDKWLLSTPWSTKDKLKKDYTLAEYEKKLLSVTDNVDMVCTSATNRVVVNLYPVSSSMLARELAKEPNVRVEVAFWQIFSEVDSQFFPASERWENDTGSIVETLRVVWEPDYARLVIDLPEKMVRRGVGRSRSSDMFSLAVKIAAPLRFGDEMPERDFCFVVNRGFDGIAMPSEIEYESAPGWSEIDIGAY